MKKRDYPYYQKPIDFPLISSLKRQLAYNNELCHTCNNVSDNHGHGNSSCNITLFIHNKMREEIINIIEKHKPNSNNWKLQMWFSNATLNFHIDNTSTMNFPKKWGDIDIIPIKINKTIAKLKLKQPKKAIKKIIETKIFLTIHP